MDKNTITLRDFIKEHPGCNIEGISQGGYFSLNSQQTQSIEQIVNVQNTIFKGENNLSYPFLLSNDSIGYSRPINEMLDAPITSNYYDEKQNTYFMMINEMLKVNPSLDEILSNAQQEADVQNSSDTTQTHLNNKKDISL